MCIEITNAAWTCHDAMCFFLLYLFNFVAVHFASLMDWSGEGGSNVSLYYVPIIEWKACMTKAPCFTRDCFSSHVDLANCHIVSLHVKNFTSLDLWRWQAFRSQSLRSDHSALYLAKQVGGGWWNMQMKTKLMSLCYNYDHIYIYIYVYNIHYIYACFNMDNLKCWVICVPQAYWADSLKASLVPQMSQMLKTRISRSGDWIKHIWYVQLYMC